jgi:hypothetical protein
MMSSRPYLTITAIYGWYSPFAMDSPDVNLWRSAEHALDYLGKADNRVITFMRDADERVARPEWEDDFRRTGTARKPW